MSDPLQLLVPVQLEMQHTLYNQISQSASNFIGVFGNDYWLALGTVLMGMLAFLKLTHHLCERPVIGAVTTGWIWMQHYSLQSTLVARTPSFVTATFLVATSLLTLFSMRLFTAN